MRAEPGNSDHATVDRKVERRENKADQSFRLDKELVNILGGDFKSSDFKLFTHKALDHTNACHIFLDARIQRIILRKHPCKCLIRKFDDQDQYKQKKAECDQKNHREFPTDAEGERQGKNQRSRRTHAGSQYHLIGVLDIRDIRRETGHETRSRVLVEIAERKALNASVNPAPKACGKSRRRIGRKIAADRTEEQTEERERHHKTTGPEHDIKILRLYPVVNEIRHHEGHQIFHHHFHDHAEYGEQGNEAVFLPQVFAEHFNHMIPPRVSSVASESASSAISVNPASRSSAESVSPVKR